MAVKWTEEDEARWQAFTGGRRDFGTDASVRRRYGPTPLERADALLADVRMMVPFVWVAVGLGFLCLALTGKEPSALISSLFH
jgi:hypothetical protein